MGGGGGEEGAVERVGGGGGGGLRECISQERIKKWERIVLLYCTYCRNFKYCRITGQYWVGTHRTYRTGLVLTVLGWCLPYCVLGWY